MVYYVGPKQSVCSYVPPLSPFAVLNHPSVSETRAQLSNWLPTTLVTHTHLNPAAPKTCEPCAVQLAREKQAWVGARAICTALPYLSAYRQKIILTGALCLHATTTAPTALAIVGRWVHSLATFHFYHSDIRTLCAFQFMRRLMNVVYILWHDHIVTAPGSVYSPTQTHSIITLLLNLANSNAIPTMNMSCLKLLLQNPINAIHLLIGHQLLHYVTRVHSRVITECWQRLFDETSSLALFIHNRLCCEALCTSKQTNLPGEKPLSGMFRMFFQFLKETLADRTMRHASTSQPTYVQIVCAMLHNTVFCQPRLAQGCAHVLHVDIELIEAYYSKCFTRLRALTQAHSKSTTRAIGKDPLIDYKHQVSILRCVATCDPDAPILSYRGDHVVPLGTVLIAPVYHFTYTYGIQHLVRLFFRLDSASDVPDPCRTQARALCSSLHLFFGDRSRRETIGYIQRDILNFGTLNLMDQSQDTWTPSVMTYMILYFILQLEPMMESDNEVAADLPLVCTMADDASPHTRTLVMPYTLHACHAVREFMCIKPLTDSVLDEVQRICDIFVREYVPELWLAFLPIAQSTTNGEHKLRTYFQQLDATSNHDTFRSKFLTLLM